MLNKELAELHGKGIKLCHLGRLDKLPDSLQATMKNAMELTKDNTAMTLNLAVNYGGRSEIIDAVRRLIAEGVPAENINEELFRNYLYTAGMPDVDLLIRTSGELRTSNFLTWQTAYTEFYFTDTLWPDFNEKELEKALLSYSQRQRRFGGP
jgi:undecaprenyl diphosphate synthase